MVAVKNKPLYINSFVYKIGNMDNNLCTFCENVEETIYHVLQKCSKVQLLLKEFVRLISSKEMRLNFDNKTFEFGDIDDVLSKVSNSVPIMINKYMYRSRRQKNRLTVHVLITESIAILCKKKEVRWICSTQTRNDGPP